MDKNKGGRPAHYDGETKKAAIAVRTAPSVRDKLKAAAEEAGRSVTQEVEARLEASLEKDAGARSPETERLLNRIAAEIAEVEAATKKRWHKDRKTAGALMEMMERKAQHWFNVDNPFDDEDVMGAYEKISRAADERKKTVEVLEGLGIAATLVPTRPGTGDGALSGHVNALMALTSSRAAEREALSRADLRKEIRVAAELVFDRLEELDREYWAAQDEFTSLTRPYRDAEQEGRKLYRDLRARIALTLAQDGRSVDYADWLLSR